MTAKFFRSGDAFRAWLSENYDKAAALIVGFHKKATGKPSITYPEALDEALCFGWIDGIRHGAADSYTIRFGPRKAGSKWSLVNIKHVKRLIAAGQMRPAGLAAFKARDEKAAAHYSYERKTRELDPALAAKFKANKRAWAFFTGLPPGYRRVSNWWVMSAKKEETRLKRLSILIADSGRGVRVGTVSATAKKT